MGATRQAPEQTLQMGIASYLRAALIRPARFWFVPNGGNLSKAQAGRFREMGLTSGVHDLHFVWSAENAIIGEGGFGVDVARFGTIELKEPKAKADAMSEAQKGFAADLVTLGHYTAEARSLDEVLAFLKAWGAPLRSPTEAVKYAFRNGLVIRAYPTERR